MASALAIAWLRASRRGSRRRLLRTTFESADRSRAHACFEVAEQASEEVGPAHLALVPSETRVAAADAPAAVDKGRSQTVLLLSTQRTCAAAPRAPASTPRAAGL